MANESAVTGPLEAAFEMACNIAAREAVRTALAKEVGGFDLSTEPGAAGLRTQNLISGQMENGILATVLAALDARFRPWNPKVTAVAASTYNLAATDDVLDVTYTATGAVAITFPTAQMVPGRMVVVKDSGLNANTNNITIGTEGAEKINNSDAVVMSANGQTTRFVVNAAGTGWLLI